MVPTVSKELQRALTDGNDANLKVLCNILREDAREGGTLLASSMDFKPDLHAFCLASFEHSMYKPVVQKMVRT
eukprot:13025280-Heterocapsa_arctica.AAC.1